MRKPFDDWEKDFIYLTYPYICVKDIAKHLNRSRGVIQAYASYNNIKKPIRVRIGDIFGKLTVQSLVKIDGKRGRIWLCKCDCGKITKCETNTLISGHSSSCGCERIVSISSGYKHISGSWYGRIKKNAKIRGLDFQISLEYLNELLDNQKSKCALTGMDIVIKMGRDNIITTASLDRIDNTKGYIEGNVQFLHKDINRMKWAHKQEYFIRLCKTVAENN